MKYYPTIIASDDFICSNLLHDPTIVASNGAQVVYCLALKVENRSEDSLARVILSILEQLNYSNEAHLEPLRSLVEYNNYNKRRRSCSRTENRIIFDKVK